MLQTLSIKNVALISNLTIDFESGFNVLLGETGAGKSIIFDALNFVLGAKVDKTLLRSGEDTMHVDAVFVDIKRQAQDLLEELGFDGDEIALSRVYNIDGKSTIRINGKPTTQAVLKEVGDILVNSYSQHESVDLLKVKNHIIMLDKLGGTELKELKDLVKTEYQSLIEIDKKIEKLGGDNYERERTKSLVSYQITEIEDANLQIGEDEEVEDRLKFLNNAEKIFQAVNGCEELLSESSDACVNSLQQASMLLSSISGFDNIDDCKQRLDSVRYEVEDICETLNDIKASTEFDENEYETLDRRHDLIKSLTKKYGGSIEKTLDYLEQAKTQLDELENSEALIAKLENERKAVYKKLQDSADKLTDLRKKVSDNVTKRITTELRELGMKSSTFVVKFENTKDITANGQDDVEFIFSANKGQELKSLSKTASGGELSRFMLAFKNIFAETGSAQTLVFDEIDTGISGETGNIVGQKLNNLTKYAQILCITHLPQVACYGDSFYYVSKIELDNSIITKIVKLDDDKIVYNIARMIGGDKVSDIALSHAKEMRQLTGKNV